jgi:hypothetical protein
LKEEDNLWGILEITLKKIIELEDKSKGIKVQK